MLAGDVHWGGDAVVFKVVLIAADRESIGRKPVLSNFYSSWIGCSRMLWLRNIIDDLESAGYLLICF